MPDTYAIRHRIGITAPLDQVHDAFATKDGVASWWTTTVDGQDGPGGKLGVFFGGPDRAATMELADLSADHVVWNCIEGPDEWVGTTLTFDLEHTDGETVVLFTHDGWREPVPFMNHCSTKWGYFMLSAKAGLEHGQATPFPHDLAISAWG